MLAETPILVVFGDFVWSQKTLQIICALKIAPKHFELGKSKPTKILDRFLTQPWTDF